MENLENEINSGEFIDDEVSSLAYDYYDEYYQKVITSLTNIEENHQTIIYNQEQLQLKYDSIINCFNVVSFLISFFLIYILLHNILNHYSV